ncbi:LptA/OstA family protein [Desulfoluna sp.]|uniref:LptA/OstA family protein n=1 Tax=Desulfoluna sp. TaxID=2045199 RepID=UPI00262B45D1|nr:LptA/OstA family protein [Desulfoluna sp.]
MKHFPGKHLWVLLLILLALPGVGSAVEGEIGINADHLTSDSQGRYALFSGNVRITRDGAILTADKVQLHYEDGKQKGDTTKGLSLIEAEGNVIMVFEEKRTTSEKAVYDLRKEVVTLTGGPPRVVSGENTLTGKTIVINRQSGAINVDSDASQRVEVKLVPGEKGFSFAPDEKTP